MNDQLRAMFRKEELELAAAIGAQEISTKDKITSLFEQLNDPLLSDEDVSILLALSGAKGEVSSLLGELCATGQLQNSNKTRRPLDPETITLYRSTKTTASRLKLIATEAKLNNGSSRYQLTCNGRLIRSIARIDRLDALAGTGNQRDEIRRHVNEISTGIRSGTQVPNSVLLVLLSEHVTLEGEEETPTSFIAIRPLDQFVDTLVPGNTNDVAQSFRLVEIDFPFRKAAFDEEKSAVLVDGQQRTAALSLVDLDAIPAFSLSVNAIVADESEAKKIFMVSNSTVKIEAQFSRALLASLGESPGYLREEQIRAQAAKKLALDNKDSPFLDLVQYPGIRKDKRPPIAYNSIFQILTTFTDSSLRIEDNAELLASVVARSFSAVRSTWPTAWAKKPSDSRLMHGAGLRAMASLLVNKLEQFYPDHEGNIESPDLWKAVEQSLGRLKNTVVWTLPDTATSTAQAKNNYVNEISNRQNTNQDITKLANFLKKESLDLDTKATKDTRASKPKNKDQ
ncbi:DGQHR domain-containing protein [Corallococcus sp. bb12-1]|uniref:DGQHR domain-containing protein n=1 Tax=Corallococcus sp. bb12-1 TaxID=2996784 RepID=UPI00226FA29C|nr:DGQHR domain-containing protein [Corallococcus sp. bb12-1]MCY1046707.1 DGQHR domain-containing protein [Corallococcus sp. bb12-1]